MPTPHPHWPSPAELQLKSAALAHAGSLHDTQADSTENSTHIQSTIIILKQFYRVTDVTD